MSEEDGKTLAERLIFAQMRKAEADAIKAKFIRDYKKGALLSDGEIRSVAQSIKEVRHYVDAFTTGLLRELPSVSASMAEEVELKKIELYNRLAAGPWVNAGRAKPDARKTRARQKKKSSTLATKRTPRAKEKAKTKSE